MNNICLSSIVLAGLALIPLGSMAEVVCKNGNRNAAVAATTPASDFDIHENGTVTHKTTQLMWSRCQVGQTWTGSACSGNLTALNWSDALKVAESSDYAGHDDWRLPNVKELSSIVEHQCYVPAINQQVFIGTSEFWHWTSSPSRQAGQYWFVHFEDGATGVIQDNVAPVRLVRNAPSQAENE